MADNAITSENASTADTIDPEFAKMFVSATQGGKPSSGVNAQQSDDSIDPEFSSLFNKSAIKTPVQAGEELRAHPESEQAYNTYKSSLESYNKKPKESFGSSLTSGLASLALEGYGLAKNIKQTIGDTAQHLVQSPIQTERNILTSGEANLPVGAAQVPEFVGNVATGAVGKVTSMISPEKGTIVDARLQQVKGYEDKVNNLIAQHPEVTESILQNIPGLSEIATGRKVLESLNSLMGGKPYDPNAPESRIGALVGQVAGGSKVPIPHVIPSISDVASLGTETAGIGEKALSSIEQEKVFQSLKKPSTSLIGQVASALTPPIVSKAAKLAGIGEKQVSPLANYSSLNNLNSEVSRLTESVGGVKQQIADLGAEEATASNPAYRKLTKELNTTQSELEDAQKAKDLVNNKLTEEKNRGGIISNAIKSGARGALTGGAIGGVGSALTNPSGTPLARDIVTGAGLGGGLGAAGAVAEQVTRPSNTSQKVIPTEQPAVLEQKNESAPIEPVPVAPVVEQKAVPIVSNKPLAQAPAPVSPYGPNRERPRMQYTVASNVKSMSHDEVTGFDKTLKSEDSPVANAVPVNSGDIESAGHGSDYMYVKFNKPTVYKGENIDQYAYANVPKSVYTEMLNSDDPYSFFQKNIRGKYNTSAVNPIHTKEDLAGLSTGDKTLKTNAPVLTEAPKQTEQPEQQSTKPLAQAPTQAPAQAPAPFMGSVPAMPLTKASQKVLLKSPVTVAEQYVPPEKPLTGSGLNRKKALSLATLAADEALDRQAAEQAQIEAEQAQIEAARKTPEYKQMTNWLEAADKLAKRQVSSQSTLGGVERNPTAEQISNATQAGGSIALNKIPADQLDQALAEIQSPKTEKPTYPAFSGKQPIEGIPAKEVPIVSEKLTPKQESIKQAFLDHFAEIEQNRANNALTAKLKEDLANKAKQANKPLANAPAPKSGSKKVSLAASQPHEGPEDKPLGTSSP